MNDRNVDISTYWARVVGDTAEFKQIAAAENPEFNGLVERIKRLQQDAFITDATAYGVQRWENMLGIVPEVNDTLDDRKARIITYLSIQPPYSTNVVLQAISTLVGADGFTLDFTNETATLTVVLKDKSKTKDVKSLLDRVLPMHIVYTIK